MKPFAKVNGIYGPNACGIWSADIDLRDDERAGGYWCAQTTCHGGSKKGETE